uniref:Uncharacterized protein n=1 Tax=Anguilla anguilla TaxID=7936 RepID=A0A0E9PGM9_ANGAN
MFRGTVFATWGDVIVNTATATRRFRDLRFFLLFPRQGL